VYFNPPLARVGLLQWRRFDSIVQQGEAHALEVLDRIARPPGA
jgi:NTE family protein